MHPNLEEALKNPVSFQEMQYSRRSGVNVRLLSPMVRYPPSDYSHHDAALLIRDDVSVLMTRFWPLDEPDDYYSEVAFATAFEIRCMATVLLSGTTDAMCSIYPAPFSITLALAHVDLADAQTIDAVLRSFRRQLKDEVDHVPYFHRPPLLGGVAYDINSYAELNGARQHDIFRAIDLSDHLLIRGLGALIQSAMLGRYSEFLESACMSLWVAMAASLELVWRRLRSEGNNNPNSKDAAAYLAAAFQSQHVPERYFEEFYEDRIRTVHPVSRFGVYPAAPLSADAFYDLYDSLVPTYDFLITGHIRQDFVEL